MLLEELTKGESAVAYMYYLRSENMPKKWVPQFENMGSDLFRLGFRYGVASAENPIPRFATPSMYVRLPYGSYRGITIGVTVIYKQLDRNSPGFGFESRFFNMNEIVARGIKDIVKEIEDTALEWGKNKMQQDAKP